MFEAGCWVLVDYYCGDQDADLGQEYWGFLVVDFAELSAHNDYNGDLNVCIAVILDCRIIMQGQQPTTKKGEPEEKAELVAKKQALKEQAKQMLLKECYKMAMNKYLRLIEMGAQGFSAREWSIIHLNTAISYQCQNLPNEALSKVSSSILIDPSYEKPYYRRLQLLDELGQYELALHDNIVPPFIKNPEIEKLRGEMAEKYRRTVGFGRLVEKLRDQGFVGRMQGGLGKFVGECCGAVFGRIEEEVQGRDGEKGKEKMAEEIDMFYRYLKEERKGDFLDSFYQQVYRLCVKYAVGNKCLALYGLLGSFWVSYCRLYVDKLDREAPDNKQTAYQQLLCRYSPASISSYPSFLNLLSTLLTSTTNTANTTHPQVLTNITKLLHINSQLLSKLPPAPNADIDTTGLSKLIDGYLGGMREGCGAVGLRGWRDMDVVAVGLLEFQHLINGYLGKQGKMECGDGFVRLFRLRHLLQSAKNSQKQAIHGSLFQLMLKCLQSKQSLPQLPMVYLCYQILHSLTPSARHPHKQPSSQLEQLLFIHLTSPKTLQPLLQSLQQQTQTQTQTSQQQIFTYLLLLNMMAYFNPLFITKLMADINSARAREKGQGERREAGGEIVRLLFQITQVDRMLGRLGYQPDSTHSSGSDRDGSYVLAVYMEVLALFCFSDLSLLNLVLSHPSSITTLYTHLHPSPTAQTANTHLHSQHSLHSKIKLLYSLTTDLKLQQQQQYAQKMGVSQQDIRKARQLQGEGEYKNVQLVQLVNGKREAMVAEVVGNMGKGWGDVLNWVVGASGGRMEGKGDEELVEVGMLVSVILRLCEKDSSRFYGPIVVNYMLDSFKRTSALTGNQLASKIAYKIGQFSTLISKKSNPNIFSYPQLQPLTNTLLHLIQSAKHELHIFEALLSLINLSSRNIVVPLSIIEQALLEQNQYIVHGGLELLNNVLVNGGERDGDGKYWGKLGRLEEIVGKYWRFYRDLLKDEIKSGIVQHKVNTSNYSHPYKIYCTILSVLMIFQTIQQARNQIEKSPRIREYKVEELESWTAAYQMLKHIDGQGGNIAITLYKLALHHAEAKTLPAGWFKGLETAVGQIKQLDAQKWGKIQRYMK